MTSDLIRPTTNQIDFTHDQVELIKRTIAVGATNDELQMFMYQSQRTGLDPFARQIYFVKRGDKATIQVSIDGFRLIAGRNKDYAGQDEPEFEMPNNPNAKWPIKAKVTVYKFAPNGQRYPAGVGVAYWDEYVQKYNDKVGAMWEKMPRTMLAKCAEALALRKAFPQELSGLYSSEEMAQAAPSPVEQHKEVLDIPNEIVIEEGESVTEMLNESGLMEPGKCTCGTTNRFHKNTCPAWTDPNITFAQHSVTQTDS